MLHVLLTLAPVIDIALFVVAVLMHAVKKTSLLLALYFFQSLIVCWLFVSLAFGTGNSSLYLVAAVTFCIKVLLVPYLLVRTLRQLKTPFASDTYLDTPLTFVVVVCIAFFALALFDKVQPGVSFTALIPAAQLVPLHLAGILTTLFLAVNRREAFSQIIALLALENWIVLVAAHMGFHQELAIELTILFEVVLFALVAATFMAMVYRHLGSIDVSALTHLTDRDDG